jgi:hypothetical protein
MPQACWHLLARDGAGAQQHGHAPRAIDDGAFNAHLARAAVQHQQGFAQLVLHMLRGGGAHAAKAVGAGRGHAPHGGI